MGLFDLDKSSLPLPNFDVSMPRIDTGSFLPNFEAGMDVFGGGFNTGSLFDGFSFGQKGFGDSSFYAGAPSFSGFGASSGSFRGFAPSFTTTKPMDSYRFPWDKPPTPIGEYPGGYSGGIGVAPGGYGVLNQYDSAFMEAAAKHGGGAFDANWLKAVAMMEGGWGAGAVSGAGAIGIMQIMPTGYYELQNQYPNWKTDPRQNIMLGAAILADKIRQFGGRDIGTERYLGVGTDSYTGISTGEYLRRIKGFYDGLQKTTTGGGGAPFTGEAGTSYLSMFGGINYPISSEHGVLNGAPPEWYYRIDDELGLAVGTHPGLDVAMPDGTRLYMPKGLTGVVERATGEYGYGYDPNGGVGTSGPGTGELRIRLSNGHMLILGHMQRIYLPVGAKVYGGQQLGLSGTAGSGGHLHFEYRIPGNTSSGWIAVDPRRYLR